MPNTAGSPTRREICADLLGWAGLPTSLAEAVDLDGPDVVLPSSFRVTDAAAALVGAASAAIARFAAVRSDGPLPSVRVDPVDACIAFQSERHLQTSDDANLWDDLAGHYPAADGWVQFHTNFPHHRAALLTALELPSDADRDSVAAVVEATARFDLERRVAGAGGICAAMRSPSEWADEPHAAHLAGRAPLVIDGGSSSGEPIGSDDPTRPLAGLRVLDLTRVIAGPVCSRTLAAYGADVLRIGAADLPVVESLLPDSTLGKRFAHADITTPAGRDAVLRLAADADVVVTGFRPGALDGRGLGSDTLFDANPNLVIAELSAFGVDGPWGGRRGFDSITQTATGIVAAEMAAFESDAARPLPCQLLDHGTGFLLTLGVMAGLIDRLDGRGGHHVTASLATTRTWLESLGPGSIDVDQPLDDAIVDAHTVQRSTAWGTIRHVRHPGEIEGMPTRWDDGPSKPGTSEAAWE